MVISYEDSVIALHSSFKECPHVVLEISFISKDELTRLENDLKTDISGPLTTERDLKYFYDKLSVTESTKLYDSALKYSFVSQTNKAFETVYFGDFKVNVKMGMYIEVFYSPFQDEVL